jgi:hypothetical protein
MVIFPSTTIVPSAAVTAASAQTTQTTQPVTAAEDAPPKLPAITIKTRANVKHRAASIDLDKVILPTNVTSIASAASLHREETAAVDDPTTNIPTKDPATSGATRALNAPAKYPPPFLGQTNKHVAVITTAVPRSAPTTNIPTKDPATSGATRAPNAPAKYPPPFLGQTNKHVVITTAVPRSAPTKRRSSPKWKNNKRLSSSHSQRKKQQRIHSSPPVISNPKDTFILELLSAVCKPDSPPAREIVEQSLARLQRNHLKPTPPATAPAPANSAPAEPSAAASSGPNSDALVKTLLKFKASLQAQIEAFQMDVTVEISKQDYHSEPFVTNNNDDMTTIVGSHDCHTDTKDGHLDGNVGTHQILKHSESTNFNLQPNSDDIDYHLNTAYASDGACTYTTQPEPKAPNVNDHDFPGDDSFSDAYTSESMNDPPPEPVLPAPVVPSPPARISVIHTPPVDLHVPFVEQPPNAPTKKKRLHFATMYKAQSPAFLQLLNNNPHSDIGACAKFNDVSTTAPVPMEATSSCDESPMDFSLDTFPIEPSVPTKVFHPTPISSIDLSSIVGATRNMSFWFPNADSTAINLMRNCHQELELNLQSTNLHLNSKAKTQLTIYDNALATLETHTSNPSALQIMRSFPPQHSAYVCLSNMLRAIQHMNFQRLANRFTMSSEDQHILLNTNPHGTLLQQLNQWSEISKSFNTICINNHYPQNLDIWDIFGDLPVPIIPNELLQQRHNLPDGLVNMIEMDAYESDLMEDVSATTARIHETYQIPAGLPIPNGDRLANHLLALCSLMTAIKDQFHEMVRHHSTLFNCNNFAILDQPPATFTNEKLTYAPAFAFVNPQTRAQIRGTNDALSYEQLSQVEVTVVQQAMHIPYGDAIENLCANEDTFFCTGFESLEKLLTPQDPDQPDEKTDTMTIPLCSHFRVLQRFSPDDTHETPLHYILAYIGPDRYYTNKYNRRFHNSPTKLHTFKEGLNPFQHDLHYASAGSPPLISDNGRPYDDTNIMQLFKQQDSVLLNSSVRAPIRSMTIGEFAFNKKQRFCLAPGVSINDVPFLLAIKAQHAMIERCGIIERTWSLRVSSEYLDADIGFDPYPSSTFFHNSISHPEYNNIVHGWGYNPTGEHTGMCDEDLSCIIASNENSHCPCLPTQNSPSKSQQQQYDVDESPSKHFINVYLCDPSPYPLENHTAFMAVDTRSTKIPVENVDSDDETVTTNTEHQTAPTVAETPAASTGDQIPFITPESPYAQGFREYIRADERERQNQTENVTQNMFETDFASQEPVNNDPIPDNVTSNVQTPPTTKSQTPPLNQPSATASLKQAPPLTGTASEADIYTFNDYYRKLPIAERAIIFDRLNEKQQDALSKQLYRTTLQEDQDQFSTLPMQQSFRPVRTFNAWPPQDSSSLTGRISRRHSSSSKHARRTSSSDLDSEADDSDDEQIHTEPKTCPSSEYLTKVLMKHAKNSRLKTLSYPANLDIRRQQFHRFIDQLMRTTNISPWTRNIFKSWPETVTCDNSNVSAALYSFLHAYISEPCQKLIQRQTIDGAEALLTLRRHFSPISRHRIDELDGQFRSLHQGENEAATAYFNRIRDTTRDCFHTGIKEHDDETLLRRALDGASFHPFYDTTYKSFQRILDEHALRNPTDPVPITFTQVESALHLIDDREKITTDTRQRSNHNQHGAFFISSTNPSANNRNRLLSSTNNRSNHRTQDRQNNEHKNCSYCHKKYHSYNECRKRQSDQQHGSRKTFRPQQGNNNAGRGHSQNHSDRSARRPFNNHSQNRGNHNNYNYNNNNNGGRDGRPPYQNNSRNNNSSNSGSNNYALNLICNACGQKGHFAARCPNRGNNNNRNSNSNRDNNNRNSNSRQQPNTSRHSANAATHTAFNVYTEDPAPINTPVEKFHHAFAVHAHDDITPRNTNDPPLLDYPESPDLNVSYGTTETIASSTPSEQSDLQNLSEDSYIPALQQLLPNRRANVVFEQEDPLSLNQRYGPPDLRNWLPDSGASLHFTPVLSDLINPQPTSLSITVADGSTKMATMRGDVITKFSTDQGVSSMFMMTEVYFVEGLSHRLLSLTCISSTLNHRVSIENRNTTIHFPDQSTFTWFMRAPIDPEHQAFQAFQASHTAPESTISSTDTQTQQPADDQTTEKVVSRHATKGPTVPVELMSRRMGFRNIKTLLTGSLHKCWRDTDLTPGTTTDNWPVQVSISHKHARSKTPFTDGPTPFYTLHFDLIRNPFRFGLSKNSFYTAYLMIVATPGRLIGWKGLAFEDTKSIIKAMKEFLTETRLLGRIDTVHFIRTDAGSAFLNDNFINACNDLGIKVEAASPKHQEMNSICEAKWKQLHVTANTMLNNARLGGAFYHHAHKYAATVLNALPARNVINQDGLPSTPYFVCYGRKPTIRNFRTFGCPVYVKRYTPMHDKKIITYKQQIQRATRGIFVGFPDNSAGWLVYCAELPTKFAISSDIQFDEDFESALAFDSKPYAGAVPIRSQMDPNGLSSRHWHTTIILPAR